MVVSVMVNIAPVMLVVEVIRAVVDSQTLVVDVACQALVDNLGTMASQVLVVVANLDSSHVVVAQVLVVVANLDSRISHMVGMAFQVLVVAVKVSSTALSWAQGVQLWRLTKCSGLVVLQQSQVVASVLVNVVVIWMFMLVIASLVPVINVVLVVDVVKMLVWMQDGMDT